MGNEQMVVEEYRSGELYCLGSNQALPCTPASLDKRLKFMEPQVLICKTRVIKVPTP